MNFPSQGYLLKRYTTLGRDSWKKRFFVIDSKGDFYYLVRATPLISLTVPMPMLSDPDLGEAASDSLAPSLPD